MKGDSLSKSWMILAGVLTLLEVFFLYEAMLADVTGYQKIFGVFAGLTILCFAVLLYTAKVVFYDRNSKED